MICINFMPCIFSLDGNQYTLVSRRQLNTASQKQLHSALLGCFNWSLPVMAGIEDNDAKDVRLI